MCKRGIPKKQEKGGNLASCVSPKVISITPNRNLISPKVTKITFGEIGIAILPSHPNVFASNHDVQGVWACEGQRVVPNLSLTFLPLEGHILQF